MRRSSLLGTTVGAFDSLRVRDPPYTWSFVEVATLAGASVYDDTQVTQDVAANSSAIATNAAAIAANASAVAAKADDVATTSALAGKRDVVDSYTKAQVDNAITAATAATAVVNATVVEFQDIDSLGVNTLSINGGSLGVAIRDAALNSLIDADSTQVTLTPPVACLSNLSVAGTLSSTSLTNSLAAKQDEITFVDGSSTSHSGITTINAPGSSVSAGVLTLPATSSGLTIVDGNGATQSQITQLSFAGGIATGSGLTTMSVGPSLQVYNYAGTSWVMPSKIWHENSSLTYDGNVSSPTFGAWLSRASPLVSDVVNLQTDLDGKQDVATNGDVTVTGSVFTQYVESVAAISSGYGLLIRAQGDPMGVERQAIYFQRPTGLGNEVHRISVRMDTSNNGLNFYRFSVNDSAGVTQSVCVMNANQEVKAYGSMHATAFTVTSDESVKTDIETVDLTGVFDRCEARSYVRTDMVGTPRRVGFISQEIRDAVAAAGVPDTFTRPTTNDDGSELLGLDLSRLTTVLWSVCKKQQKMIEGLTTRVTALEKKRTKKDA